MSLKAVLFDFDGVIANSKHLHQNSWDYACNEVLGKDFKKVVEEKIAGKAPNLIAKTIAEENAADVKAAEEILAKKNEYLDSHAQNMEKLEGVCEMFEFLNAAGIKHGIASNANRAFVKNGVEQWSLLVEHCYGYEDYNHPKPDPEPYQKLAQSLGIDRAEYDEVLVFEDSQTGLEAALSAGMKVIHIQSHSEVSSEQLEQCEGSFKNLKDAMACFKNLL